MRNIISTAIALLFTGVAASAEGWTTSVTGGFDREPLDAELTGGEGRQLQLEDRYSLGVETTRDFTLGKGRDVILSFGVSGERYPEKPEGDRLFFDGAVEYHHDLPGDRRQWRFRLEGTHARDPEDVVFSRARISATYRAGVAPRQLLSARLRLGYRNQDEENTFDGYDQAEFLGELDYSWQSADWNWYLLGTLYREDRDADHDYYSYGENGMRFLARYRLEKDLRVAFRLAAFDRNYVDGGRADQRWHSTVGIEKSLNDKTTLEAYVGYMNNSSTFPSKDFSGPLIGVSFEANFE